MCQESTNSGVFTIYVLIVYITIPNSQQLQQKNGPEVLSTTDLLEIMDGINPLFEATTDFTIIEVEGVNRAALSLKFILLIAGGAAGGAILAVVTCVVVIIIVVV